jgi:hypothetical protein
MALLDYAITVFICGLVGWLRGVMGHEGDERIVGEEIMMVGEDMSIRGEEGEDAAGYR